MAGAGSCGDALRLALSVSNRKLEEGLTASGQRPNGAIKLPLHNRHGTFLLDIVTLIWHK
jgi:hypothetical protein